MSFLALIILFSSYLFPPDMLLSISEIFQSSNHTGPMCSLCGMTRAFIAISHGDLSEAKSLNYLSVIVYGLLVSIVLIAIIIITRDMCKLCFLKLQKIIFYNS